MKLEAEVKEDILVEAGRLGINLWRNNSGALVVDGNREVRFGLGNDSKKSNKRSKSSDYIGIQPITGKMIAVEIKREGWVFTGDEREVAQLNFIELVKRHNGLAGFAASVDDFRKIVGL